MFSSISRCKPLTEVITSFTADANILLDIATSIDLRVNNQFITTRPVQISRNSTVEVRTISPAGYSDSVEIPYSINGYELSFIVVNENRSSISFTLEGLSNRWYRFDPSDSHFISYYNFNSSAIKGLGFNDIPFANDIGSDFKDYSSNNFIVKSPTGLFKKRPNDEGIQYDQVIFQNDYLLIDKSPEFCLGSSRFTIDIRVKPFQNIPIKRFLVGTSTKTDADVLGWSASIENSKIQFNVNGSSIIESETALLLNEWNHVAITRTASSVQIWINGKLSGNELATFDDIFEGSLKIGTIEDETIFPKIGNKLYNFNGALSCLRIVKGKSLYLDEFEVPEPVLSVTPETVLLTIQEDPGTINLLNAIPDPLTKTVYFYNQYGHLLDNIKLPSPPCQIERFVSDDGGFFIVSCRDKRLYKITLDKRVINKDYLLSNEGKNLEWLFQLPFETDVAFVGSFTTFARLKNNQINIGQPNSISMSNGKIWVGGFRKIWQLDKYFTILREFDISGTIVGIKSLGDKCAVIIKNESTTFLQLNILDASTGASNLIHTARWLSDPILHKGNIFVSDSAARAILKINPDNLSKQTISLENNTPSYIASNSSYIFIACHDNNRVLIYSDHTQTFTDVYFPEKVTWVSPLENSFIVSHYLKDKSILSHSRPSIIYEPSKVIKCGTAHASILPFKVKNLGSSSYTLNVNNLEYWVDGNINSTIKHGSYFSLSKKIQQPGYYHIPVLIGDVAVDFKAISSIDNFYPKNLTFDPLEVNSAKDVVEISFQYKHDFIETFNSAYAASVFGSINYGFLKKNFSVYTGESKINDGDIISICIPFGNTIPNAVITLTLGSREFLIPINSSETVTNIQRLTDKRVTSLVSHEFTVNTAGTYFIPSFSNSVGPLRNKVIELSEYDIFNLGGAFDTSFPLNNLKANGEAFVPFDNGLFDIYVDLDYPVVVNTILLKTNYGPETIQEIDEDNPVDEEGNPNLIERTLFRRTPVNFEIKASNDLITWETIAVFENVATSSSSWIPDEYRKFQFENTVTYRYWRFKNTTTQELGVSLNSIVFEGKFPSIFELKINGQNINSYGQISLSKDDVIDVKVSTNDRLYDFIRYFISGPENFEFFIRTKSKPTVSSILFAEINEPTLRQEYVSESKQIDLNPGVELNLYSYDPFLTISKNDISFSQTITVSNGNSIKIKKIIRNIFDSTSIIYDKQIDDAFKEYINVDVISVSTKNVTLSSADKSTNVFALINVYDANSVKNSSAVSMDLAHYESDTLSTISSAGFSVDKNAEVKRISLNLREYLRSKKNNFIANSFTFDEVQNKPLLIDSFDNVINQSKFEISSSVLDVLSTYVNFLVTNNFDFKIFEKSDLTIFHYRYLNFAINKIVSENFDYLGGLMNSSIADRFQFVEYFINHFISNRHATGLYQIIQIIADKFNSVENHINTFSSNRFETHRKQNSIFSAIRYNTEAFQRTKFVIDNYQFNRLKNSANAVNRFVISFDRYHKIVSSIFNYDKNLLHSFLLAQTQVFDRNSITYFGAKGYLSELLLNNMFDTTGYLSESLLNNPFYISPYDFDALQAGSIFLFKMDPIKLTNNIQYISPSFSINRIQTHNILNYISNIQLIRPNYIFNVNFSFSVTNEFLYIFKEDGFYGFFGTQGDAIAEANRKKHSPFTVYKIPDTNKWTYKREYYFIDGCSISDGRIKRLVQGG